MTGCGWQWLPTWPASRAPPASTPNLTCAATLPGCAQQGLDPRGARRPHLELYIRWMQEIRPYQPSTVSRWFSVTAGFYRTCVIDGTIEHSPADHVRRPAVPPESTHAGAHPPAVRSLHTVARDSTNLCDFALV